MHRLATKRGELPLGAGSGFITAHEGGISMAVRTVVFCFVILLVAQIASAQQYAVGEEGTFSIIGRDPATGELGMAVQSKTIAVGSRTRGGKGGVAIFAHQAASNPMYTMVGIELIEN